MERLVNCNIVTDIDEITHVSGGAGERGYEVEILFSIGGYESKPDYKSYKLTFGNVWEVRWSTEAASNCRFAQFPGPAPDGVTKNNIYIVKNSKRLAENGDFLKHVSGDTLRHYALWDNADSVMEILAGEELELVEVESSGGSA